MILKIILCIMSSFTSKFSCSSKVSKKGHLKQNKREGELGEWLETSKPQFGLSGPTLSWKKRKKISIIFPPGENILLVPQWWIYTGSKYHFEEPERLRREKILMGFLKYNLHTIKCTNHKHTVQSVLTTVYTCVTAMLIRIRNITITPDSSIVPLSS